MQPTLAPAPHPMRGPSQVDNADRALEEQLLGAVHGHHGLSSSHGQDHQLSGPSNPHHHNIDPAIAGPGMMHAGNAPPNSESPTDGRKGKRELSTSKRAAQNRAAQRAFRQRKEGHIKTLETQVREFNSLSESYKALQAENYQLRDYIISLQSRLIEAQGEYPQPPSNIDLHNPSSPPPNNNANSNPPSSASSSDRSRAPTAPMRPYVSEDLQASAAQAVAENNHRKEEARKSLNMTEQARPVAA